MATHNLGRVAYADKGAYNSSTTYISKDVVQYNNGSYVLQADTATGIVPTNTSYWTPMQDPTALNQATASANTAAQSANTAANSAVKAAETANTVMNNTASPIRKSIAGKFIKLDNAANKPLSGLKLYGRTEQATTTGKNILPDGGEERTGDFILYPVAEVFEGSEGKTVVVSFDLYSPDGSAVSIYAYQQSGLSISNGYDFMPGANAYARYSFATTIFKYEQTLNTGNVIFYSPSGAALKVKNVQVEFGATATSYEPYTGGIPSPSPNWPQPLVSPGDNGSIGVKTMGKNLLPINSVNTNQNDAGLIELTYLPAGTYTLSADITKYADDTATNTRMSCSIIYTDGQTEGFSTDFDVNKAENDGITRRKQRSFLIRADKKVQRIVIYALDYSVLGSGRNAKAENIQIEYGPTATAYEPYKNGGSLTASTPNGLPGIPVTSGGNYVDANGQRWVCDYKDYERGVYVKMVERAVCDSSNAVFAQSGLWYVNGIIANATHGRLSVLASHYKAYGTNELQHGNVCVNGLGMVVFGNENYTDEATMRADIAQNPVTIAFVLPVPDETPIPADELAAFRAMSTFDPYTVVYSDSDVEMTVDYIGETEKFVHEVIDDRAAPPIVETANGSVVSITDGAARPAVEVISHIEPLQSGSGDPSPDNVRPISGWNSAEVYAAGKNMLGAAQFVSRQVYPSDAIAGTDRITFTSPAIGNTGRFSGMIVPVEVGSTVTFGMKEIVSNGNTIVNLYYEFLDASPEYAYNGGTNFTTARYFTATATKPWLIINLWWEADANNSVAMVEPQLEIGSKPTAFDTIKEAKSLTVALPETVYGGTLDWTTGVLTVDRAMLALTGDSIHDYFNLSGWTATVKLPSSQYGTVKCSHYVDSNGGTSLDKSIYFRSAYYGDHICGIKDSSYQSRDAYAAYLDAQAAAGTPVQIVYILATPITIQLSPRQLSTLKGTNNVWSDCGSTELSYIADTKLYIDKKIAAIATALIEQ